MVKKSFHTILILTFGLNYSCSKKENNEPQIIASFADINISEKTIDSIAQQQIYNLKLTILESYLDQQIIRYHQNKTGENYNSLFEKIETKIDRNLYSDTNKIKEISYLKLIDSLKTIYSAEIKFKPPGFKNLKNEVFHYLSLTDKNTNVVYIVSDFNCISCQRAKKTLIRIIEKYKNIVEFRYICFSEYYGIETFAFEAANRQNELFKFYKYLSNKDTISSEFIELFIKDCNLDKVAFIKDISNKSGLLETLKTKDKLIENGIYATPTYIVNNKIVDGKYNTNYLEDIIKEEFHIE